MSTDTVLNIISGAAAEVGILAGQTITASDTTTKRLVQGLNRVGRSLKREAPWASLVKRYPFRIKNGVSRYPLPPDWDGVVNSTMWDNSSHMYAFGTITSREYETLVNSAAPLTSLTRMYRFIGSTRNIEIVPTPAIEDEDEANLLVIEYRSSNWLRPGTKWAASTAYAVGNVVAAGDNVYKCTTAGTTGTTMPTEVAAEEIEDGTVVWTPIVYDSVTADTDEVVLDRDLLQIGLIMQFLDNKGFNYDKYAQMYQQLKQTMIARDIGGRVDTTVTPHGRRRYGNIWASKFYNMPYRI